MTRKDELPQWMGETEYVCPRCGNSERGNVDPLRVTACSYCMQGAAAHVEAHPEQYGIKADKNTPRKFRMIKQETKTCKRKGCGKPFVPANNRQEFCPACRKYARAERAKARAQEKEVKSA